LKLSAFVRYAIGASLVAMVAGCRGFETMSNAPGAVPYVSQNTGPTSKLCPRWPGGSGLLRDGDFHDATYPSGVGYITTFARGQKFAPSWVVTIGSIDFIGDVYFRPPHGVCSIDLDGTAPGSKGGRIVGGIAHTPFKAKPKQAYTVTFLFSGNGACGPTVKRMKIATEDSSKIFKWNISDGHDAQNGDFAQRKWTFTAGSSKTKLTFSSLDKPTTNLCGPVVAAVRVVDR
jgi:hypothetical protein